MAVKKRGRRKDNEFKGIALSEKAIEKHVGERSLRLGKEYAADDAIFRTRRQGDLLKAHCRGQSASHYVLSARIKNGRIVAADCNCPVGEGGHCKHVAAMLLSALESPNAFAASDPLQQRLAECSKEKLVELIAQLVEQHADLESWLELALPTALPVPAKVSSAPFRRMVVDAFAAAGYGWETDRQLTAALRGVRTIGDRFAEQQDFAAAAAAYIGFIEAFVSEFESFQDETGNIVVEANECATALGGCIGKLDENSKPRQAAIEALFRLLKYDIEFGGISLGDDVPEIFEKQTTVAERAMIVQWIRDQPLGSEKFISQWRRQHWGAVLLKIGGKPDDDEGYLRHCREFGLTHEIIARLLERGRVDEALDEIDKASDYEAMQHADQLLAHKHKELAHTSVEKRYSANKASQNRWQLREWLMRFYRTQKDWPRLLDLEQESFRERPTLASYQAVREVARRLKTWDNLRGKLLANVPQNAGDELIRIYLDEGEIEQAIQALESRGKQRFVLGWGNVDLEVAKQAEKSHPEAAIRIYQAAAERRIAGRGRDSYREACSLLKKAKQLYSALDRDDYWKEYRQELLHQHRSLRALQEEAAIAKL